MIKERGQAQLQGPLKHIVKEIVSGTPVQSIYLVGSRARNNSGHGGDYDIIAVMKNQLIPIYLLRLRAISRKLSGELGIKVDANPLPTFRLRNAKGNLFLMKIEEEARLLYGQHLLANIDTGDPKNIVIDWYFSFFSSLLKDLIDVFSLHGEGDLSSLRRKIGAGLRWLSTISNEDFSQMLKEYAKEVEASTISGRKEWSRIRDKMLALFEELVLRLLHYRSQDLEDQVEVMMMSRKGKSVIKNFEYVALLLLVKRKLPRLDYVFSRRLFQDRYRAALVLLSAAVQDCGVNSDLTLDAYRTLKGCLKVKSSDDPLQLWNNLRAGVLEYWSFAQPLMGI